MIAYYNEHDPFAAAWLRELIADGLIAPGEVDERSIEDVRPADLAGFVQCHFFAGIGVWSLALRQAGWPDAEPIWTGSCPCQPFSAAGKGGGFYDERHLWPAFHWLIEQCAPELIVGEQVASKDGLAWLDLVSADLEASGYAFGAADTCAAGFGAPHIRQRLYWMADALSAGRAEGRTFAGHRPLAGRDEPVSVADAFSSGQSRPSSVADGLEPNGANTRVLRGLADANGRNAGAEGLQRGGEQRQQPQDGRSVRLEHAGCERRQRGEEASSRDDNDRQASERAQGEHGARIASAYRDAATDRPGPLNGLWRAADWLCCTDGKWRPVAPGTFPLAPAGTVRNRVGTLRGAGNAINLAQAVGFVEAVIDVRQVRSIAA